MVMPFQPCRISWWSICRLPGRVGETQGWKSVAYKDALKAVDKAMGTVLDLYREQRFDQADHGVCHLAECLRGDAILGR